MSNAPYVKLRDLCDVNQGLQIPISKRFREGGENRYFYITVQFLKDSYLEKFYVENPPQSSICNEDDIIVVRTGSTGQIITGVKGCFHNNFFKINYDKEKVVGKFLYYCLTSKDKKMEMKRRAGITTIPDLNHFMFLDMEIPLPEYSQQLKATNILDVLSKKIELNNKINAELESMAKLIYDYWFVQFDFPDEYGNPYKSSGGKMVYNEELKREIPEGWDVIKIIDQIKLEKTGDWGKEIQEGNYSLQVDCIRGADLNGLNGRGKVKSSNRFILEKNQHKLLSVFDIIIEISGGSPTQSTGRMAFLTDESFQRFQKPLICSNFCKAISLKNNNYFYNFVYQWNNLYSNGVLFGWEGKTSGIKNLLFDAFVNSHKFSEAPETLAKKFSAFVDPLHKKKQKLLLENSELESLREWLLPMLMNGQVKIK